MERPLPITLGLFWVGLIAVAIFWIGMRVYGSRRSALILMGISTAGFIAGAIVHPFTGRNSGPPPIAATTSQVASTAPTPVRSLRISANNESTVNELTTDSRPAAGSVDELGFTDSGGNLMQPQPLVVPAGSSLLLQGWSLVPTTNAPPAGVFIVVDGTHRLGGDYQVGIARPDVAKSLNNDNAARAGFSLIVRTTSLATGLHHFQLVASDGKRGFTVPTTYDFSIQ